MQYMPCQHLCSISPTRNVSHTCLFAAQSCSPILFEDLYDGFHFRTATDVGLRIYTLKENREQKICLCSGQQLRLHVALHKLPELVRQHEFFRCRASASTGLQHQIPKSAELPQQVHHLRHIRMLRPLHCPSTSAWRALIPVQHLLRRQS